jgi:hypothetical protein
MPLGIHCGIVRFIKVSFCIVIHDTGKRVLSPVFSKVTFAAVTTTR